jgi:SAM-dependent methyltransferase
MANSFYEDEAVVGSSVINHRSKVALGMAKKLNVRKILDVGCGDGEVSQQLAQVTGAHVTCVDVSETAIQACRARGLEARRLDIGEARLPFPDASFELVFMTEVIEHLVRPDRAMEDVRRVLTPDGHLILSTPNLACLPNRFILATGLQPLFSEVSEDVVLGRRMAALGQGGRPVGHLRLYTKGALIEFLERQGFINAQLKGAAFHTSGVLHYAERLVGILPGLAMILVVIARRSANRPT